LVYTPPGINSTERAAVFTGGVPMATTAKIATQEQIETLVATSRPERLSDPGKRPITGDHAANVVQLTTWGQTSLAADHLLFPELNGFLPGIVAG